MKPTADDIAAAKEAASRAASAMAKARWIKIGAKKRSEMMHNVGIHGGRPRATKRCWCGAKAWTTAVKRNFDCCRRAGKFPTPKETMSPTPSGKKEK